MRPVIVVGAGIGGLTAAAILARYGIPVVVMETQAYPGGCASTFDRHGFRFDAGATLAAGFGPDMPLHRLGERLELEWGIHLEPVAMQVHLSDGQTISRWTDRERWREERLRVLGSAGEPFWAWQERTAKALWALIRERLPWPPQRPRDLLRLLRALRLSAHPADLPGWIRDAFRPAASRLPPGDRRLRELVNGQLWISAQTTVERANALYAAAALDLPHTGVGWLPGGIGAIAARLADAIVRYGGEIRFRHEVVAVRPQADGGFQVETRGYGVWEAEGVILNMPPAGAVRLLREVAPPPWRRAPAAPPDGWGAFVVYAAVAEAAVPSDLPLHHQILQGEPFDEGGAVFLSISPAADPSRAPRGFRALTLSTHTDLRRWWSLFQQDREAYARRKAEMVARVLQAAARVLPRLPEDLAWAEAATPITFQQFTGRPMGWVGGFPQPRLGRSCRSRIRPRLYLVGDSVFPGQSIPAVALGAWRVAEDMREDLAALPRRRWIIHSPFVRPSMEGIR